MSINKLVRDRIPSIVEMSGKIPVTRKLSDKEFELELYKKLQEEVSEFLVDKDTRELVDIIEVIYSIAKLNNLSRNQLEAIRQKKVLERGAFDNKLFLSDVLEKNR